MIKINIKSVNGITKEINIKKTLSGDFMLREHPEIDIIIIPSKQKVLVLPKDEQTEHVYALQERLFKYMVQKGVILPESIISGNVYGSLQGGFSSQPPGGEDPVQVVIYSLANFIEDEMPKYNFEKNYEDKMEKDLINPNIENSTELGEVPQEPFKGSIPKYGFPTRGIYRYNY
jgi:hypothetical protein